MAEEKVEKWKLKPETKSFLREYRKVNRMSQGLAQAFQMQLNEAQMTRQMLEEVEGMKNLMLNALPEDPAYELEGQDLQMRY